jgi:glycosyltransferase involved in cell wall biosynthesis
MEFVNDYEVLGGTFHQQKTAVMKIALVSTGLGRVLRGFESFTASLFDALKRFAPTVDVTLFQGGRCSKPDHTWVPNLHRYDVPARWLGYEKGNLLEKRSFALSLYPRLRAAGYDVVHYNELTMGSALYHLRRVFGGKYKLLYCGGSTWSPAHYGHRCDFAQLLTGPMYEQALEFGIPESRLFLIPYGLDPEQFSPMTRSNRAATRQELGIPQKARVVLSVATIDRATKRIDYLLREVARLDSSTYLLVAGQKSSDTPELENEAERLIPGRWRFVSWPQEKVNDLYGTADVFVLTSLIEAFGRVTVEALLTGLPAIIHNGPIFRWVAEGSAAQCINMAVDGELSKAIEAAQSMPVSPSRDPAAERFSWQNLAVQYVDMYQTIVRVGRA